MRVFGYDAYIHVLKEFQKKINSKSVNGMFMGYNSISKAYHGWKTKGGLTKIMTSLLVMLSQNPNKDAWVMKSSTLMNQL